MRTVLVALALAAQTAPPIFRFETDGFWLNLHHFLYVLGRVEARMPDIARDAVARAPADEAAGLAMLSDADRRAWREAVGVYAGGLSRMDAVFDAALVRVTNDLRRAPADQPASTRTIDPVVAGALDRAAPIYRRAWWPAHRDGNRAWLESIREPLAQHGPAVLAYLTRAYQETWMSGGYPVNVSAWTNWAGAYSTSDALLVISSKTPGVRGALGLEAIFHESMHQWDDAMQARLRRVAAANQIAKVNDLLSHALIFYTTGEAMRAVRPDHVSYADVAGIWKGRMGAFKPALDAHWKPYLDGKTTLDAALLALLQ